MCCLFGIVDYENKLTAKQKNRLLRNLSIAAEDRGTDATGIAYNNRHGIQIFKRPVAAHKLFLNVPKNCRIVMGHTRLATQGKAKQNYNNHPFSGRIGKERFALAHNGVLYNDYKLRSSEHLPYTRVETDSYVAVQLLEQEKELSFATIANMAEKLDGTFSLTVLSRQDDLYIIKGDNPMSIVQFPDAGVYIYASTTDILKKGIQDAVSWLGKGIVIDIDMGEIMRIDREGHISRSEFDISNLLPASYVPYGSYSMFEDDVSDEDYIKALKSVAGCFGYSPEMIDRLIAHGFAPEEIEDMLYECEGCAQ